MRGRPPPRQPRALEARDERGSLPGSELERDDLPALGVDEQHRVDLEGVGVLEELPAGGEERRAGGLLAGLGVGHEALAPTLDDEVGDDAGADLLGVDEEGPVLDDLLGDHAVARALEQTTRAPLAALGPPLPPPELPPGGVKAHEAREPEHGDREQERAESEPARIHLHIDTPPKRARKVKKVAHSDVPLISRDEGQSPPGMMRTAACDAFRPGHAFGRAEDLSASAPPTSPHRPQIGTAPLSTPTPSAPYSGWVRKLVWVIALLAIGCGDDGGVEDAGAAFDGGASDAASDAGDAASEDAGAAVDAGADGGTSAPFTQLGTLPFEFRLNGTTTSEDGALVTSGTLRLIGGAPPSLVDLSFYSDDETEVQVEPRRIRFSSRLADPVFLTIRGVDDPYVDGPQEVTLSFTSSSADERYAGALQAVARITNEDDEAALEGASDVAVGADHACATSAGAVVCWGEATRGQLGPGHRASATPVAVGSFTDAVDVAAGEGFSCVRRGSAADAPSTVACWGAGTAGQLGRGASGDSPMPAPVTDLDDAVAIDAGPDFACAVRATGAVVCWGEGARGQLGDGGMASATTPQPVMGIDDAVTLTVGGAGACALRAGGGVRCWGDNTFGQATGTSTSTPVTSATNIAGLSRVVALSATHDSFCALRDDDAIRCWGNNDRNQLGDRSGEASATQETLVTPDFARPGDVLLIAGGRDHHCVTTNEERLVCWGATDEGLIGNGETVFYATELWQRDARTYVTFHERPEQLVAGGEFTCTRTGGRVHCMGPPAATLVSADGWTPRDDVEVAVRGIHPHDLKQLVSTPLTTCALDDTERTRCWGGALAQADYDGSQGHGGTVARTTPGPVIAFEEAGANDRPRQLEAGPVGLVAQVLDNASVFYWGAMGSRFFRGAVPISYGGPGSAPGHIVGANESVLQTLGAAHSCWARITSPPRCFGDDTYGQLGDDAAFGSSRPSQDGREILGVTAPDLIASGANHSCAVQGADGVLKCWGRNNRGQLGDGTSEDRATAIRPSTIRSEGIDELECGGNTTCVLAGGILECVGDLGDGVQTNSEISSVEGIAFLDLSEDETAPAGCVVASGVAHCWGVLGGDWASPMTFGEGVEHIAVGNGHVCWATATELRCRGNTRDGALGDHDLLGLRLVGAGR